MTEDWDKGDIIEEDIYVAIPNFEGYIINCNGVVKSVDRHVTFERQGEVRNRFTRGRIIKPRVNLDFPVVVLHKGGKYHYKCLASLVALSFYGSSGPIEFFDGNPFNVSWENIKVVG